MFGPMRVQGGNSLVAGQIPMFECAGRSSTFEKKSGKNVLKYIDAKGDSAVGILLRGGYRVHFAGENVAVCLNGSCFTGENGVEYAGMVASFVAGLFSFEVDR